MKADLKLIVFSTLFILLFAVASWLLGMRSSSAPLTEETGSWACAADVKVCPDGTEVWRTAPYCLFADCPKP